MAEEPEPQVKGARPRPRRAPGRPPAPPSGLRAPYLAPSPGGRPARARCPLGSAPLGRPLPTRRVQAALPRHTLGTRPSWLGAGGLRGGARGPPEKLGGAAGRACPLGRGGRRPARGPPRWPGRGRASWQRPKQCALTGVPRRQWPGPSTRAGGGRVLRGRGRGLAGPPTPTRIPASPPGRPKSVPGTPGLLPISEAAARGAALPGCETRILTHPL